MSSNFCCKCHGTITKAIVLICDHQLCEECAHKIKKPQGTPPLDQKFRLICPACDKNTITINIQNLMNSDKDQFLFDNMESSELNQSALGQIIPNDPQKPGFTQRQLKQMSYSQRFSNIWAQRKTPDISQRVSKASNDSKRNNNKSSKNRSNAQNGFTTQCHMHKQSLIFFCEQQKKAMCIECMYQHTKKYKSHQICQIKDAIVIIQSENKGFKSQAKKKIQQIQKFLVISKSNKGQIEKAYEIHQQLIDKQFKQLQLLIKAKKNETMEYLQKIFTKKQRQVTSQISDFNYLKKCLQQYEDYPLENQQSQLYFYNAYSIMRDAIHKGTTKIKKFQKQDLACFDKLCSTNDFKVLLDKFLKPKKDGKQSKAQSRNSEIGTQKPKSVLYDEYKTAKKNLQKINKMQKQHKANKDKNLNYLNNYVIDIQKKDSNDNHHEKGTISSVRQRKSSMGAYNNQSQDKKNYHHKALTPTRLMNGSKKKK